MTEDYEMWSMWAFCGGVDRFERRRRGTLGTGSLQEPRLWQLSIWERLQSFDRALQMRRAQDNYQISWNYSASSLEA